MKNRALLIILALLTAFCMLFAGCDSTTIDDFNAGDIFEDDDWEDDVGKGNNKAEADDDDDDADADAGQNEAKIPLPEGIPAYTGKAYAELNGNLPEFKDEEIVDTSYEMYSALDNLGRCGYTMACVGKDIMPTKDRESISSVKPSGWVNKKYDTKLVDGGYIYNRCHLIGFQLTGENANERNLITGTRYMNVDGMLPFENMVADHVKETGNHVMYRVTPMYVGNNLVASGVKVEAYSVEDEGDGICFNVFVYNIQPGITINYATGDNWLSTDAPKQTEAEASKETWNGKYVLHKKNKKIHKSTCSYAKTITGDNREEHEGSLDTLISNGYTACGTCKPLG